MNRSTMCARAGVLTLAATCTVALALPALSSGARQVYPPGKQAQTFNGGAGGWTATDSQAGPLGETLCVVSGVLICPSATSTHVPDGGTSGGAGDGFAETEFGVTLGVAGSGTSVWESKSFAYNGVHGKKAKRVKFKAKRTSALTELLALPGSSATYTAEIVPEQGGNSVEVGNGGIPAASDWMKLQMGKVSRKALKQGQRYSLQITSVFETGVAGIVEDGTVGYDDVKLVAQRKRR